MTSARGRAALDLFFERVSVEMVSAKRQFRRVEHTTTPVDYTVADFFGSPKVHTHWIRRLAVYNQHQINFTAPAQMGQGTYVDLVQTFILPLGAGI